MRNAAARVCGGLILCGLLSCLLVGCDPAKQEADSVVEPTQRSSEICEYLLYYGPTGWEGEMFVNSFPQVIDSYSGSLRITHLLKNGRNSVRIKNLRPSAEEASDFHVSVVKLTIRQTDPDENDPPDMLVRRDIIKRETFAELTVKASGEASVDAPVTFLVELPMKFAWQNADKIEVLTEADKMEMYKPFQKLSRELLSKDAKGACAVMAEMSRTLRGDLKKVSGVDMEDAIRKSLEKMMKKIFSSEGYVVSLASRKDLVFHKYDRAVRVSAKDSYILRADTPESGKDGGLHESVSYDTAVFMKLKGRWVFYGH